MKLKVRLQFSDQERQAIDHFCSQIGVSIEHFCRQSVFYAIKDSYRRAAEMEKANGSHNATGGNSAGDSTENRGTAEEVASSSSLAHSQEDGSPSA